MTKRNVSGPPGVANFEPMPWPPAGVNIGRWNTKRTYGGTLQDSINQSAAVRNAIYLHPDDFAIGKTVYWMRNRKVLSGTVVKVYKDQYHPAMVRSAGPTRYHYKPTIYAYCNAEGRKPCVCDLPIGQRTECQHKTDCPHPGIAAAMSKDGKTLCVDFETRSGVELMSHHSPAALASLYGHGFVGGDDNPQLRAYVHGASHSARINPLMGPDEYGTTQNTLADYHVRKHSRGDGFGIYLRKFNVALATFAPNSATLRHHLGIVFDAAFAAETAKAEEARVLKLPIDKRIKARQQNERDVHYGWYTCQCGQWVHDKACPCSVCQKPKRKARKKK